MDKNSRFTISLTIQSQTSTRFLKISKKSYSTNFLRFSLKKWLSELSEHSDFTWRSLWTLLSGTLEIHTIDPIFYVLFYSFELSEHYLKYETFCAIFIHCETVWELRPYYHHHQCYALTCLKSRSTTWICSFENLPPQPHIVKKEHSVWKKKFHI